MPSICFVVNEIYPLHRGGIGRLIFNMKRHYGDASEIYLLLYGENFRVLSDDSKQTLHRLFGRHRILFVDEFAPAPESDLRFPVDDPVSGQLNDAYRIYTAIKSIIENGDHSIETFEFIDIFAPAFYSVQARFCDPSFARTRISVRLHSTRSITSAHETGECDLNNWHAASFDIERKALRDADLIVGHLHSVVEANRRFYDLDDAWLDKVIVQTPPVVLDEHAETTNKAVPPNSRKAESPRFVFSSRIEPFKQPALFVEAAKRYIRTGGPGTFMLACYGFDDAYVDEILGRIPEDLRQRIVHMGSLDERQRLEVLRGAIVCIPSSYESFCFFAYESLARGNAVILNEACPAFGDGTPWHHDVNCLKFDGSVAGLCEAFEAAVEWKPASTDLPVPSPRPYWLDEDLPRPGSGEAGSQGSPRSRLTIVTFGAPAGRTMISELLADETSDIAVHRLDESVLDHEFIHVHTALAAAVADADYVAFCPDGMLLSSAFLQRAVSTLDRHDDLFGVIAGVTSFARNGTMVHFRGEAPSTALRDIDRIGMHGVVFRRAVIDLVQQTFGERWWRQRLMARLVRDDLRIAVDPAPEHAACVSSEGLVTMLTTPAVQAGLRQEFEPSYWDRFTLPVYASEYLQASDQVEHLERELGFAAAMCEERLATIQEMDQMIAERDKLIEDLRGRGLWRAIARAVGR